MSYIIIRDNITDLICDDCEAEGAQVIAVFDCEPSYPATSYPQMLIKGEYQERHLCPTCQHKQRGDLGDQYAIVQASWRG